MQTTEICLWWWWWWWGGGGHSTNWIRVCKL